MSDFEDNFLLICTGGRIQDELIPPDGCVVTEILGLVVGIGGGCGFEVVAVILRVVEGTCVVVVLRVAAVVVVEFRPVLTEFTVVTSKLLEEG